MQNKINELIKSTMDQVKANKKKIELIKGKKEYYTLTEINNQIKPLNEKNAELVNKLKETLKGLRVAYVNDAHNKAVNEAQLSDAKVSNILSMLTLTASTIREQDLINMYQEHYHVDLIKRSIEGVANTRHFLLGPVLTKAEIADHEFTTHLKEFADSLTPSEINEHLEVVSAVMGATR